MLGLPEYEVTRNEACGVGVRYQVRYKGRVGCPHCGGLQLQCRDRRTRRLRHDLAKHTVFDVVPGRSEATLESYLDRLQGKSKVRLVCSWIIKRISRTTCGAELLPPFWPDLGRRVRTRKRVVSSQPSPLNSHEHDLLHRPDF